MVEICFELERGESGTELKDGYPIASCSCKTLTRQQDKTLARLLAKQGFLAITLT